MDDLETMFSLNNWPGHLSYVLIAVSLLADQHVLVAGGGRYRALA